MLCCSTAAEQWCSCGLSLPELERPICGRRMAERRHRSVASVQSRVPMTTSGHAPPDQYVFNVNGIHPRLRLLIFWKGVWANRLVPLAAFSSVSLLNRSGRNLVPSCRALRWM